MSSIVEVNHLTKAYGSVVAVNDVSFSLEADRIYGLLGRNGAGKTTIMQILTAQSLATSGDVRVFGAHPYENNRVLSQVCFIKESQTYPTNYRVGDVLSVAASLYPNWDGAYAEELREEFRLPPSRKIKALSRGMLSSVGIVIGLASHAPLTIFDEPYLGLDAVARSMFYDRLLENFGAHPRTVVLSTHLIDEVSRLLDHVLVIDSGKLLLNAEAEDVRGRAFSVVGAGPHVERYLDGREVIHRQPLGSMLSATVLGLLDSTARKQAEALGLELVPVSLQQLVVHMTQEDSQPVLEEAVR